MCSNIFRKNVFKFDFSKIERTLKQKKKTSRMFYEYTLKSVNQLPLSLGESEDTFGSVRFFIGWFGSFRHHLPEIE